MKKYLFLCLTVALSLEACNSEPANPVEGTWSLIYAKSVENDSVTNSFPGNYEGSQIKMWTDNYWMFTGRYILDTIAEDAFGGGTYTLEGVVYKESIMYHSAESYIGQTFRMRIVVENDTLVQVWPAMENGEVDKSNYRCEKYVKVK